MTTSLRKSSRLGVMAALGLLVQPMPSGITSSRAVRYALDHDVSSSTSRKKPPRTVAQDKRDARKRRNRGRK